MRLLSALFFCLLVTRSASGQNPEFYDTVLNHENCRDCYFVVLDVESTAYVGKAAIESDDLYEFLKKTKDLDRTQSKEFIKGLLLGKKKLALKNARLDENGNFVDVPNVSEHEFRVINNGSPIDQAASKVEGVAAKGCVPFINHYFLEKSPEADVDSMACHEYIGNLKERLMLRTLELGDREMSLIIYKLFKWQIPTRMDDLSGLLVIDKRASSKQ